MNEATQHVLAAIETGNVGQAKTIYTELRALNLTAAEDLRRDVLETYSIDLL